eukprot:GEMP01093045.1.p1 GENE.GEMP01093045.1~~GEMP01093045.1.p1  ORF type:complete len:153 (+),score=21.48 GEMP01093045.1:50-508(+)
MIAMFLFSAATGAGTCATLSYACTGNDQVRDDGKNGDACPLNVCTDAICCTASGPTNCNVYRHDVTELVKCTDKLDVDFRCCTDEPQSRCLSYTQPGTQVNYDGALAFCKSKNRRLCTLYELKSDCPDNAEGVDMMPVFAIGQLPRNRIFVV